jgi:hypothetical protein
MCNYVIMKHNDTYQDERVACMESTPVGYVIGSLSHGDFFWSGRTCVSACCLMRAVEWPSS